MHRPRHYLPTTVPHARGSVQRLGAELAPSDAGARCAVALPAFPTLCPALRAQLGCLAPFDFISDFYFITLTPIALLALIVCVGVARIKLQSGASGEADPHALFSKDQIAGLRSSFFEIDTDGSGDIDARELRAALEKHGTAVSQKEADEVLAKVSGDRDGRITFEEFLRACALRETGFHQWSEEQRIATVFNQHAFAALFLTFVVLPVASSKIFVRVPRYNVMPLGSRSYG